MFFGDALKLSGVREGIRMDQSVGKLPEPFFGLLKLRFDRHIGIPWGCLKKKNPWCSGPGAFGFRKKIYEFFSAGGGAAWRLAFLAAAATALASKRALFSAWAVAATTLFFWNFSTRPAMS